MALRLHSLALAVTAAACACAPNQQLISNGAAPHSVMASGSNANDRGLQYFSDVSSTSDMLPGTPAHAWARLVAAYASLGIPVTASDSITHTLSAIRVPVSGRIGTRPLSNVVDCGSTPYGTPRATAYKVTLTAVTRLDPSADGTTVRTAVAAWARDETTSSGAVQCSSTGSLERAITEALGAP